MPNQVTTLHCSRCGLYLDMKEYIVHRDSNCTKHGVRKAHPQDRRGRFIKIEVEAIEAIESGELKISGGKQIMDTS